MSQLEDRFWKHVNKKGDKECWIWMSATNGRYGKFRHTTSQTDTAVFAHRFSYEIAYGKIEKGLLVCHTCDNSLCVNPKHLFLGTQKTNMQDASSKKRTRKGKLSSLIVAQIIALSSAKIPQKKIGEAFGVTQSLISGIVRGKYKNYFTYKG